ncbi:helix-turn-helix domain-containing protein, partial [Nocardia flavorosea]
MDRQFAAFLALNWCLPVVLGGGLRRVRPQYIGKFVGLEPSHTTKPGKIFDIPVLGRTRFQHGGHCIPVRDASGSDNGGTGMADKATDSTFARRMLGRQLRHLRETSGVSVETAKKAIGVGHQTLWRLETGQSTRISALQVRELCRIYKAPKEVEDVLLDLVGGLSY